MISVVGAEGLAREALPAGLADEARDPVWAAPGVVMAVEDAEVGDGVDVPGAFRARTRST